MFLMPWFIDQYFIWGIVCDCERPSPTLMINRVMTLWQCMSWSNIQGAICEMGWNFKKPTQSKLDHAKLWIIMCSTDVEEEIIEIKLKYVGIKHNQNLQIYVFESSYVSCRRTLHLIWFIDQHFIRGKNFLWLWKALPDINDWSSDDTLAVRVMKQYSGSNMWND